MTKRWQAFVNGAVGNIIEWYDFALYGFFAPILATLFFGKDTPHLLGLIYIFAIFAAGFLMRPLGAILYGHIGDRLGRKPALIFSILLMTMSAFLIGCLPTYGSVGSFATVVLILLRLLQGLSAGGETAGSLSYVLEHQPKENRTFIGAATFAMIILGILLASFTVAIIDAFFTRAEIAAGIWRLPFLFSIVLGTIFLYMRVQMPESPEFKAEMESERIIDVPIKKIFREHKGLLACLVGLHALAAASFNFIFIFLPSSFSLYEEIHERLLIINTISLSVVFITMLLFGYIAGKTHKLVVLMISIILMMLSAYPLMTLIGQGEALAFLSVQASLAILVAMYEAPLPATMVEVTPTNVRYSLISLAYNLGFAIFGGFTPLISSIIIQQSDNNALAGLYVVGCAVVSLISLYFIRPYYFKSTC